MCVCVQGFANSVMVKPGWIRFDNLRRGCLHFT